MMAMVITMITFMMMMDVDDRDDHQSYHYENSDDETLKKCVLSC